MLAGVQRTSAALQPFDDGAEAVDEHGRPIRSREPNREGLADEAGLGHGQGPTGHHEIESSRCKLSPNCTVDPHHFLTLTPLLARSKPEHKFCSVHRPV